MRIDAYNQVAQLYGIQKNLKTQKAQNAAGPRDQVSVMKYRSRLLAEIIRSQNRQSLKQRISGKIKSQN